MLKYSTIHRVILNPLGYFRGDDEKMLKFLLRRILEQQFSFEIFRPKFDNSQYFYTKFIFVACSAS